ncbi:hypothetical protein DYB38_013921, partial [Aphanomyces astaci]
QSPPPPSPPPLVGPQKPLASTRLDDVQVPDIKPLVFGDNDDAPPPAVAAAMSTAPANPSNEPPLPPPSVMPPTTSDTAPLRNAGSNLNDATTTTTTPRLRPMRKAAAATTPTTPSPAEGGSKPSTTPPGFIPRKRRSATSKPAPPSSSSQRLSSKAPHFAWTDGSLHRAPEDWVFPITNCRSLWELWYVGDHAHGIGPYRTLTKDDIKHHYVLKTRGKAAAVVQKVIDTAVDHGIVASADRIPALPKDECLAVFEQAFAFAMDAKLHTIDATLRRVCRRLDALEEEVQSLPIKFIRCFQEDTSGLRSAMEMLTESLAGKNAAVVTEQQHDASPIAIVNASSSFKHATTPTATPPSSAGITTTSNKEHVTVAAATVHPSSSTSTLKHTSPPRAQSSWSTEEEDPEWMFPSTTCRVLWNGWFHGDNHVGPYSTLRDSLSDQQSKHRFDRATLVMQTLIQMAIDLGLAVSEAALASLPRRDLPIVFDQVFRHLIQQTHDGSLARPGFEVLTYNTAVQLNYLAVAKILQRCPVTTPSRSPTPLPSSSFSEAKPSANNPQAENPNH